MLFSALLLAAAAATVSAVAPPQYDGLSVVWKDEFQGYSGDPVDATRWKTVTGLLSINGEFQSYSANKANLQISGGGSVQIAPQRDSLTGAWTSGRIETRDPIMPTAGKRTRVEGRLRFGGDVASRKQGIWPAFWMMGDAVRHGTGWPLCGELDILEQRNGDATAFGTAHCGGTALGGVCNEPIGRGATVSIPADIMNGDSSVFHAFSVTWDLTDSTNWQNQQIVWALDGNTYFTLTGAVIGDAGVWGTLAHSPFNIILNVAVGGAFPGPPNLATAGGYDSMMEVEYVAVYSS